MNEMRVRANRQAGWKTGAAWSALAIGALALPGQTAGTPARLVSAGTPESAVLRSLLDPHTGECWLLVRDSQHPGGPGRLVRAGRGTGTAGAGKSRATRLILRAGDRLVVEEKTPVVEARLEAVALASAAEGERVAVRLTAGGRVMQVVAVAPGRAAFLPAGEARP